MPEAPPDPIEPPAWCDDYGTATDSTAATHSFYHGIRGGGAPAGGGDDLDAPRPSKESGKLPVMPPERGRSYTATDSTAAPPVQGQLIAPPTISTNAIGL